MLNDKAKVVPVSQSYSILKLCTNGWKEVFKIEDLDIALKTINNLKFMNANVEKYVLTKTVYYVPEDDYKRFYNNESVVQEVLCTSDTK